MDKKTLKYSLSILLAAVLLYFALRNVDWTAFVSGLKQTNWIFLVLFCIAAILALVFRAARWKIMLSSLDPSCRIKDTWNASNVGNLLNLALPGTGEFARCAYISSKNLRYEKALGTIVCERAFDMLCILILLISAIAFNWERLGQFFLDNILKPASSRLNLLTVLYVAVIALAIFFIIVYKLRHKVGAFAKISSILSGLWDGIKSFAQIQSKGAFVLYTIGIWTMYVLMSYFVFLALPSLGHLGFADALFLSSVGNIASVIPVPGGIGAYHYLIALSLQNVYAASWETGILFATLNHELHAVLILVLGAVSYLFITRKRARS